MVTASFWKTRDVLVVSAWGFLDSASAAALLFPGLYLTVKSNCGIVTHLFPVTSSLADVVMYSRGFFVG